MNTEIMIIKVERVLQRFEVEQSKVSVWEMMEIMEDSAKEEVETVLREQRLKYENGNVSWHRVKAADGECFKLRIICQAKQETFDNDNQTELKV